MSWKCLAPDCEESGDDWQDARDHRKHADHPDHGEVWE